MNSINRLAKNVAKECTSSVGGVFFAFVCPYYRATDPKETIWVRDDAFAVKKNLQSGN